MSRERLSRKVSEVSAERMGTVYPLPLTGPEPKPEFTTQSRTFRVWLDTNQYQKDMASVVQGGEVSLVESG